MYNKIKLPTPFERLKKHPLSPEKKLFKAVILQAILDSTSDDKERDAVLNWMKNDLKDFEMVCDLADMTQSQVIELTKEAIELNNKKTKK